MTSLDATDDRFLNERKAAQRFGLFAFPAAAVLVALLWAGLFAFVPVLVNPFEVLGQLETGVLVAGSGGLTMFAVVGVLAMNTVLLLMIVLAVLGVVMARRERRYLKLIEKLKAPSQA